MDKSLDAIKLVFDKVKHSLKREKSKKEENKRPVLERQDGKRFNIEELGERINYAIPVRESENGKKEVAAVLTADYALNKQNGEPNLKATGSGSLKNLKNNNRKEGLDISKRQPRKKSM